MFIWGCEWICEKNWKDNFLLNIDEWWLGEKRCGQKCIIVKEGRSKKFQPDTQNHSSKLDLKCDRKYLKRIKMHVLLILILTGVRSRCRKFPLLVNIQKERLPPDLFESHNSFKWLGQFSNFPCNIILAQSTPWIRFCTLKSVSDIKRGEAPNHSALGGLV